MGYLHECDGEFCEIADNILGDCDEIKFRGKIKRSEKGGIMLFSHFHGKVAGPGEPSGTPHMWFKADAITGKNDGEVLPQWDDESGNGWDMVQATVNKQPTYQTNELNSLPIVRFDGVDDRMAVDGVTGLSQPSTIFIVFKQVTWTSTRFIFDGRTAGSMQFYQFPDSPKLRMYAGAADPNIDNSAVALNTWAYATIRVNGASSFVRVNGGNQTSGSIGSNTGNGFTIASTGADNLHGHIEVAEIMIYDGAEDYVNNESYLAAKYNL